MQLTFTVNTTMTNNMEHRCTGINRMRIRESECKNLLIELQRVKRLQMFIQLCTAIGGTGYEHACDELDVAQKKDLRDKTGDLVSDLKISSD